MKRNGNGTKSIKRSQGIFLFFFLLFPTIQFIVFYFGVNFNSILMSFQTDLGETTQRFVGFENYKQVLEDIFVNGRWLPVINNSLYQYLIGFVCGMPVHVIVAYAIFKKIPCSGFFKIMLFLPTMITSMVFVICGRLIITEGFQSIFGDLSLNLLDNEQMKGFWTVLLFGYWHGFAGGLIIYLGAMGSISKDVMEYDKLEQLSSIKELWYIVIPLIFPTITTYIVVGLSAFFTNYGHFFSFYKDQLLEPYQTFGYSFFVMAQKGWDKYPYAAAAGLLFSIFLAPITLTVKYLLEKFGPSEN